MKNAASMGPVSGLLWLAAVAVAVVCHFLPGAPQEHAVLFWGLTGLTAATPSPASPG